MTTSNDEENDAKEMLLLARKVKQDSELRYEILVEKIENVRNDVKALRELLLQKYVTEDQFLPVRAIVYGLVGLVMTGVLGSVLALVLRK